MYTTQNAIDSCETMLLRREDINIDAPIGGLAYTLRRVIPRLKTLAAHEAHGLTPEEVAALQAKLDEARDACRDGLAWMLHRVGTNGIPSGVADKLRRVAEGGKG